MERLAENWFWVLIGILFVGMHLFGHGGHGGGRGHGGHGGGCCGHGGNDSKDQSRADTEGRDKHSGHRH